MEVNEDEIVPPEQVISEIDARWRKANLPYPLAYVREDERLFTISFRNEHDCATVAEASHDISVLIQFVNFLETEMRGMEEIIFKYRLGHKEQCRCAICKEVDAAWWSQTPE